MISEDNFLTIPEFILLDAIEKGLQFVRDDYRECVAKGSESTSYLFRLLGEARIQRYKYLEQGKAILLAEIDDPRRLTVDLMYNMEIKKVPAIYIALAQEQAGESGMGLDEGYQRGYYGDTTFTPSFTRRINTSYNVMIVSDNSNEVVLLYHFMRAMLLSLHPHLNLKGIENIAMSGQDLQLYSDMIPKGTFMRAVGLSVQYEITVPDLQAKLIVNDIKYKSIPKNK